MPYITQSKREEISPYIKDLLSYIDNADTITSGHLNYIITLIIKHIYNRNISYQSANDIVGALEGAKAEFQRRMLAPLENSKIKENGDVYD